MKLYQIFISATCLANFVVSCGGRPAEPINSQTASLVWGSLNGNALGAIPVSNSVPSSPVGGVTTSALSMLASDCSTVTPNPLVDADGDSIAKTKKYTFSCENYNSGGTVYTRKGTIEIADQDETVSGMYGGIRVDYDIPVFISEESGNKYSNSYKGFWDYKKRGDSLVSSSDFTGTVKYKSNSYNNDYTYHYTFDYKMTPHNPLSPWSDATINFEGSFELYGNFALESNNGNLSQYSGSWVVNYKGKDLKLKSGCAKTYDSGSIIIVDGSNSIEIKYSCNTAKLYVNGQESNWWNP